MTRKKRLQLWIGAGVLVLAGAVSFAAVRLSTLQGALPAQQRGKPAPEFIGITKWLNSPPLTLKQLHGKVVWIDFWTYSCINCVRTLPDVRAFYARYHQAGLEIVGVHSPEFSFEKNISNITAAIKRYRLPYPIAVDNVMGTWNAYHNDSWPHVYLIDRNGNVVREDIPLRKQIFSIGKGLHQREIARGRCSSSRLHTPANPFCWLFNTSVEYRAVFVNGQEGSISLLRRA